MSATAAAGRPRETSSRPPRILYVAYWGAMEPLGQALILPVVRELARRGAALTLVTFEKPSDAVRPDLTGTTAAALESAGVAWQPLGYHKTPRIPATAYDVFRGWLRGVFGIRRARVDLVLGRTFIGGIVGRTIASTLRVPFVFHNEGFYPDEMVDGGFWAAGSLIHRTAKLIEAQLYDSADGVIVLSSSAAREVSARPRLRSRRTPVAIVPSCVDLERFQPRSGPRDDREPLSIVYSGAVGGRYQLDRAGRFTAILAQSRDVRLRVYTREPAATVARLLRTAGLDDQLWTCESLPHQEMPARLARADFGLFFLASGTSEHACSPTKIGEYWASGIPVVTTPGVSDVDAAIDRFRCGVVLRGHSDAEYARASREIQLLLGDPGLAARCRAAGEEHYSLRAATDRQIELLRDLARQTR